MATVTFDNVQKMYGDFQAVKDLNLEIGDGEFMVLVGPSGCGKTTSLRMIAGLEEISAGTLRIGDRVVNDVPPKDRDIAMVFQSYALYPHMTVAGNIAYPLKIRKRPEADISAGPASPLRARARQVVSGRRGGGGDGARGLAFQCAAAPPSEPRETFLGSRACGTGRRVARTTHIRTRIRS